MTDKGKGRAIDLDALDDDLAASAFTRPSASSGTTKKAYLDNLNDAQLEAVTWSPRGGLQILAGPGSGKTRVLTSRVAYLVQECGIQPQDLIVVTFTNKAANEMKHRLKGLLGQAVVDKIMMGTFHSVAVRYLRKYGKAIELPNNFVIADSSDSQSIFKPIVVQHNAGLKKRLEDGGTQTAEEIKVSVAQSVISKAKSKGVSEDQFMAEAQSADLGNSWKLAMADIYIDYQLALRASNTLDFDDLLVFCERMLQKVPNAVKNVKHVLVDEFQDTNTIQYNIVKLMAKSSSSLTIVGDPDQLIYAWRSADIENLQHMLQDFKNTKQVMLEENYRSTSSILHAALAVVEQDKERIQKSLKTSHPPGPPVVLRKFESAQDEAAYIAYEVKRTIAYSGNTLDFNDFSVLVRYNALTRNIEAALQSAGIPSRMIGGHKFFDRAEVKDILAYLQLADNPSYTPAFRRVVNVPKRGVGDKTIKDIEATAKQKGISCYEIVSKAVRGNNMANIKPGQKTALRSFCEVIKTIRKMAVEGTPVQDLIEYVVTAVQYKEHLERTHGVEHTTKLENVNELKSFAEQLAASNAVNISDTTLESVQSRAKPEEGKDVIDLESDESEDSEEVTNPENPLRNFLASSMLSTDTETQDARDDKTTPKVTISTCHAAKGLEWPVVFVPAAEVGVYPAFRKSDPAEIAEERRLFYVAMTRAQALLHITRCAKRMERGQTEEKEITEFLRQIALNNSVSFSTASIAFDESARKSIASVTRKPWVDEEGIKDIVELFHTATVAPSYSQPEPARSAYGSYSRQDIHLNPSKPMYPGEAWRMNSYAGDQAKRYASKLPNPGMNRFAGAFATSSNPAVTGQAPGFTSALSASGFSRPTSSSFGAASSLPGGNSVGPSTSTFGSARPFTLGSGSLSRPFKPPTMARASQLPNVSTVETRLTQQKKAVIFNPISPKEPQGTPYTLPEGKEEDFSYLRALAKDETDEYAPRQVVSNTKRPPLSAFGRAAMKRSKS